MVHINKILQRLVICMTILVLTNSAVKAQNTLPIWWFGVSGAANFNFYDGTTQRLNNSLIVPTAFHKGSGVSPYGSILMEYRPAGVWGAILNVGYDSRSGKFDDVVAPCNCPATLSTNIGYITVEPSLRLGILSSGLHFFAGPSIDFNLTKDFTYKQLKQPDTRSQLSEVKSMKVSGQVGIGYDINISSPKSTTQVNLSPFVSYHPYFGREPRTIESWSITTVRAGIALKFGKARKVVIVPAVAAIVLADKEVIFSVRGPKAVLAKRPVSETLPLLNSVFFDDGSVNIPNRYVLLNNGQAAAFTETNLQKESNQNMPGRSTRQLNVYHNILNILGDRLRSNPAATITLTGSSSTATDGKAYAESVKQYLVTVFGISGSRIATVVRNKPLHPSEQPGGTKELTLLRVEDTRVDINSVSPELLVEVGGGMMKPILIAATQIDPLDNHVVFNVDGATEVLKDWSVNVTNSQGVVQRYGPYTSNKESVPGTVILGDSPTGDYKVTLLGNTKRGALVQKESTVHLVKQVTNGEPGLRYSILFDFDKVQTIESYNKFLSNVVAPLITNGSTVIIHGHTDVIGSQEYNQKLSDSRARQTQTVIEQALRASGRSNVKFETMGYGEDESHSPFDNGLPEERFYNRTVIIDIVPF